MHFNTIAVALYILSATESAIARPTVSVLSLGDAASLRRSAHPVGLRRRGGARAKIEQAEQVSCVLPPLEEKKAEGAAGEEAAAGEGEEEEAAENEVEIESEFDVAVPVEGGDLKQDLVFTPSTVGKFEFEFQSATADEVTVTENTTPAPPPAGFEALEPNSYIVSLAQSNGVGLTLSKIDYIFDAASARLAGKDITAAQVGKLCAETGAFVISEALGGLEFELEENEVTLDLNKNVTAEGEWGIFLPIAAAAVGAGEGAVEATPEEAVVGEGAAMHEAKQNVAAKEEAAKKAAHEIAAEVAMTRGHAKAE